MREIKFRGLKKSDNTWIVGDLHRVNGIPFIQNDECHNSPDDYEVIPETVGQFIGLTDKNGVEIYEGDVLQYQYEDSCEDDGFGINKAVVCFQDGKFCCKQIDFDYDKIGYTPASLAKWTRGEVITIAGNIHENTQP